MAKKPFVKIILDTNWYVSATINRRSRRRLYEFLSNPQFQILYTTELLREYKEVIGRKKFRKIVSETITSRFLNLTLPKLKNIETKSAVRLSRDSKDNFLLALALKSNADYLITGDDDLLVLNQIGRTKIVRMSEFYSLIIK